MTEDFELTRRKALAALASIGAASAGAGLGTSAYFSDQETFENNELTAGTLDLKVGWSEHYSDWSPGEGDGVDVRMYDGDGTGGSTGLESGETGLPANDAWLIAVDDPGRFLDNTEQEAVDISDAPCDGLDVPADLPTVGEDRPVIDLEDVKPGDFGEVTFDFALCDNPGYVWLNGSLLDANENGLTEPEADDPDEGDGVELLDEVRAAVWVDDGNNYQNGDESPLLVDSLRNVLAALNNGTGIGLAGDTPAPEGGGTGRDCFAGADGDSTPLHSVVFAWWLPVDHANEIQSDSVTFDLGFYTEQCRHNDGVGLSTDLEAYYPLEGGAADVSGNGYDGGVVGDVSYASGQVGQAASFDGSDDYLITDPSPSVSGSFTLSVWLNGAGFGHTSYPLAASKWQAGQNRDYLIGYSGPQGRLYAQFNREPDGNKETLYGPAPATDTWYHCVLTYDASSQEGMFYVDGTEVDTGTGPFNDTASAFVIGSKDGGGNPWNGHVDDVRIYSRALSASEVQSLYDSV
jgi:predicted ribosomally synthesized peptide with SipW-like signal peptide